MKEKIGKGIQALKIVSLVFAWIHIVVGVLGIIKSIFEKDTFELDYYFYIFAFGVIFIAYVKEKVKNIATRKNSE